MSVTDDLRVTSDPQRLFDLDPDHIRCPYPIYTRLRAESPVHYLDETGCYVVSRHADVQHVLRNPDLFSSRMPTGPHSVSELGRIMGELAAEDEELAKLIEGSYLRGRTPVLQNADPPLHTRQRALVNRAFSPPRVKQLEDPIRDICERLVDAFIDRGEVELVHEFGVPLPLTVIALALGVPDSELATFKRWSDDFVVLVGNHKPPKDRIADYVRSRYEFGEYFAAKVEERRADPQDDLVSDLVQARIDGEALSMNEMLGMFSQFLVAGNETTTKHICSTILLLLERPEAMAKVRGDMTLIPNLVEESLRFDSPVQGLYRTATADTKVGDVPIAEGSHVMVLYASANRDDEAFTCPEAFDVDRPNAKANVAFGIGPHFCLGAPLARTESKIALEVLLTRLDDIALAPGRNRFEYEPTYVLHGLKELHLTFRATGH